MKRITQFPELLSTPAHKRRASGPVLHREAPSDFTVKLAKYFQVLCVRVAAKDGIFMGTGP